MQLENHGEETRLQGNPVSYRRVDHGKCPPRHNDYAEHHSEDLGSKFVKGAKTPMRNSLHWHPVQQSICVKLGLIVYKTLNSGR